MVSVAELKTSKPEARCVDLVRGRESLTAAEEFGDPGVAGSLDHAVNEGTAPLDSVTAQLQPEQLLDELILHWAKVAEDAAKRAAEYDKVAEAAKNHMLAFMGDSAVLRLDGNKVFRRKLIQKKPYTVEASSYIDARFGTTKE